MLIAGGGTGTMALYMSESLNNTNAEIIYIDFSVASLRVSKARALFRKIGNIIWINDWLESLDRLGVGNFHFIESSGVLHHLKDINSGVNILKDRLLPQGGGMDVMLYGRIGRLGIYSMQKLLRLIFNKNCDTPSKLRLTRHILKRLPESNWFLMGEENINDHLHLGDSGTYDMLLHNRDTAFNTIEVEELIRNSDIDLVKHNNIYRFYDLGNYGRIPKIWNQHFEEDTFNRKHSIHELITGDLIKHEITISTLVNKTKYSKGTRRNKDMSLNGTTHH